MPNEEIREQQPFHPSLEQQLRLRRAQIGLLDDYDVHARIAKALRGVIVQAWLNSEKYRGHPNGYIAGYVSLQAPDVLREALADIDALVEPVGRSGGQQAQLCLSGYKYANTRLLIWHSRSAGTAKRTSRAVASKGEDGRLYILANDVFRVKPSLFEAVKVDDPISTQHLCLLWDLVEYPFVDAETFAKTTKTAIHMELVLPVALSDSGRWIRCEERRKLQMQDVTASNPGREKPGAVDTTPRLGDDEEDESAGVPARP